ncbi:MAG: UvrD-helicase domain-containing protein [Epulopiscium sp.]|nr:UvrD-helicase domain-containing protein [Candidatus Epulonipiscium sp.]
MAKQIILAVAGSGKTYYICNSINTDKKNLILAYTNENISNIKRELIDAHGCIPNLTNIMTFDSFIYRYLICPYEPTILEYFGKSKFKRKGITTMDPPPMQIKLPNGKRVPNPKYSKKECLGHYVSKDGRYYCSNLSELLMFVKDNGRPLMIKITENLNKFYDQIMIDEFQDFRKHNYDLIIALSKGINNVLLVGDFYQHSVSAVNNSGKPFKKGKNEITYQEFIALLKKERFKIDDKQLLKSRRCSSYICDYVKNKLQIQIESCNNSYGKVIWVKDNIQEVLENDSIIKLVYQKAKAYAFTAVNWSYSKGDTLSNVCVILTKTFEDLDKDTFFCSKIPTSTINKLYVAMTRTKGNLYLIKASDFDKVKRNYENNNKRPH